MSRIYHSLGILSKGQLVETDRSGLVAGYVGQTALKTEAANLTWQLSAQPTSCL